MKVHRATSFSPVPVLFILVQFILMSSTSPVITDKAEADSPFLRPASPSLLAMYDGRKVSSDFTGEFKDQVVYKSDGDRIEIVKSPGSVYLESLDEEKLKNGGVFDKVQVLGFMMDLLQREVVDGGSSGSCATSCGRGQETLDIPLCFACVGLANAHLKPVAVSRKNQ